MPYKELFDDVIEEYLVKLENLKNEKGIQTEPALLRDFLWTEVDRVVGHREEKQPVEGSEYDTDYSDYW